MQIAGGPVQLAGENFHFTAGRRHDRHRRLFKTELAAGGQRERDPLAVGRGGGGGIIAAGFLQQHRGEARGHGEAVEAGETRAVGMLVALASPGADEALAVGQPDGVGESFITEGDRHRLGALADLEGIELVESGLERQIPFRQEVQPVRHPRVGVGLVLREPFAHLLPGAVRQGGGLLGFGVFALGLILVARFQIPIRGIIGFPAGLFVAPGRRVSLAGFLQGRAHLGVGQRAGA